MKTKASIVVMSHLSDAQEENNSFFTAFLPASVMVKSPIDEHINFAKYIILYCKGDLNQEIDADELWKQFKTLVKH